MSKRTNPPSPRPSKSLQEPPRKQRKPATTAKSLGLSKDEFAHLRPNPLRKHLKTFIRTLTAQLESTPPEGAVIQSSTAAAWFGELHEPLQAVLDVGVGKGLAFAQCHEVLKVLAGSWRDLAACPTRSSLVELMSGCEMILKLPWGLSMQVCAERGTVAELCGYVWKMLLRTAANDHRGENDAFVLSAIKEAYDNGIRLWCGEGQEGDSAVDMDEAEQIQVVGRSGDMAVLKTEPDGERLAEMVRSRQSWEGLPSTVKVAKKRTGCRRK